MLEDAGLMRGINYAVDVYDRTMWFAEESGAIAAIECQSYHN